jgi:hypothetical protein
VRQRGKEAYKLKLANKNYKYYNSLESGKQVVGPISAAQWCVCVCACARAHEKINNAKAKDNKGCVSESECARS